VNRVASAFILLFILGSTVVLLSECQIIKAQIALGSVSIRADGTIGPDTAPIQRVGDVYTLISDYDSIKVQRSNIILDGNDIRFQVQFSSLSAKPYRAVFPTVL
jgi:hypothetical protein